MRILSGIALGIWLGLSCATASYADEPAIRQFFSAYLEAFNKQDIPSLTSCWADAATHLDRETGERTEGREAILGDIAAAMKERPKLRIVGRIERIRMLKPDVAQVEGVTDVGSPGEEPSVSHFTAIVTNEQGKWSIQSIEEMPAPRPARSQEALKELEWLVGRWVDRSDKLTVETNIRWSADGAFLLRSFASHAGEVIVQQGTQVIGWDPRGQQIRSWTFNSDGSFGDAIWSKSDDAWLIKSSQTLADGKAASGTFVLKRVDDNTLTLQLIGQEIEGEAQPTQEAVKVVRVADKENASPNPNKN